MSKKEKEIENAEVFEVVARHVEQLYTAHERRFMDALEANDKKTLMLNFRVTLDLSDNAPVVTTRIGFKDVTVEDGMDVTKNYSDKARVKLDDPREPRLPLEGDANGEAEHVGAVTERVLPKVKGRGRAKKDGKAAAARNDE